MNYSHIGSSSPAKEPREEYVCFFAPSQVEKAVNSQGRNVYEKIKLEFEDLKKTCTILVANLHASEKKLEAVTVENLVMKSDASLDELQRENKQLQDERTGHRISQRNCLNEIQSLRKETSDLYTNLLQVKQANNLRVNALQLTLKKEREQKYDQIFALWDADEVTAKNSTKDVRFEELQQENKQLQDERTSHRFSQRKGLNGKQIFNLESEVQAVAIDNLVSKSDACLEELQRANKQSRSTLESEVQAVTIENLVSKSAARPEEPQRENKQSSTLESEVQAVSIKNPVSKSDARLEELQQENKQSSTLESEKEILSIERSELWDCLNEVQSLKERSDLYQHLRQVEQTNELHINALKLTLKKEREQALKQKQGFQDEVAPLQNSLNIVNHCIRMAPANAMGELSDGGLLSSMDRPEGSDVTSRLRAEIEGLKAQLKSSAESFVTSRRQLTKENVVLQTKLELLTPQIQEELEWREKCMRLHHFGDNGAIPDTDQGYWVRNNGAILDTDLGCWIIHQRRQLREYEGNKRKRIDLLNSIDFNWGDDHPFSKKHGKKLRSN
jgi:hypothetical protein